MIPQLMSETSLFTNYIPMKNYATPSLKIFYMILSGTRQMGNFQV